MRAKKDEEKVINGKIHVFKDGLLVRVLRGLARGYEEIETKRCCECGDLLPIEKFHTPRLGMCKKCHCAYQNERQKEKNRRRIIAKLGLNPNTPYEEAKEANVSHRHEPVRRRGRAKRAAQIKTSKADMKKYTDVILELAVQRREEQVNASYGTLSSIPALMKYMEDSIKGPSWDCMPEKVAKAMQNVGLSAEIVYSARRGR